MKISKADTLRFFRNITLLFILTGMAAAGLAAQDRQALLVRGNEWTAGIPGFGNNVFSALFGEYRVETAQEPESRSAQPEPAQSAPVSGVFSVRVSGENLVFDPSLWQPRPGSGISGVLQRQEGQALLISFPFSGGDNLGAWTVIFHFPQGLAAAGLDDPSANRFFNTWYGRFRYFLSLIKTSSDISLPAVLRF